MVALNRHSRWLLAEAAAPNTYLFRAPHQQEMNGVRAKLEKLPDDEDAEKHLDILRPMIPELKELSAQSIHGGLSSCASKI